MIKTAAQTELQARARAELKARANTGDPAAIRILTDAGMWETEGHRTYTFADLKIRTKDKRLIVLAPNEIQADYLDEIIPRWRQGDYAAHGLREIDLKARQFGFSTLILAWMFLDTVNNPETQSKVMAHDTDSTEMLFRIIHRFYNNLPDAPATKYSTRRELEFSHNGSIISVQTAGTKTAGRGSTPSNIHCSEVAFWPDPEIFTGLLQGLPATGNIFEETTANGRGGEFYDQYQAAKLGLNNFTPRFYAWFEFSEYSTPAPDGFEPTPDELMLVGKYGLTNDQLHWRRNKRAEPGMADKFAQEYPADDVEAFLTSGSTFFERFDRDRHVKRAMFTPDDPPPHWYIARGGIDWGFADPFAFVLTVKDERGKDIVLESFQRARLSNEAQADMVCAAIDRWGIPKDKFDLICDGSMWNSKTINAIPFPPDIEAYWKAGLRCIPADQGEGANKFRNSEIRKGIETDLLEIYEGYNTELVKSLENAKHDPLHPEKLLHDISSHLVVALGNAIAPYGADAEKPKGTEDPHVQAATYLDHMARKTAAEFDEDADDNRPWGY